MWVEKVIARALYRGDVDEKDIPNNKLDKVKQHHDAIYEKEEKRIKTLKGKSKEKMQDKFNTKTKKVKQNGKK